MYRHYGLPYHYGYYGKREAEPTAEPAADAEADPEADPWLYYHGLGYAGLHPYGYGYHGLGTLTVDRFHKLPLSVNVLMNLLL